MRRLLFWLSLALTVIVVHAIASGTFLALASVHGFFLVTGLVTAILAIGNFAILAAGVSPDPFVHRVLTMVGVTTALCSAGSFCCALLSASHQHRMMVSSLALALEVASAFAFQCMAIYVIWTAVTRRPPFAQDPR